MKYGERNDEVIESADTMAGPCIIIIMGASGDLAKRKLLPAIYNLVKIGLVNESFVIVGFDHNDMAEQKFKDNIRQAIEDMMKEPVDNMLWNALSDRIYYLTGDVQQEADYQRLRETLVEINKRHNTKDNFLFYLAVAPVFFPEIIQKLGNTGLAREEAGNWRRVILEKPFGHDLQSAQELNRKIAEIFEESQVYRIDHYLGKETVQNILVFRFANGIFEPIWNGHYIDHVQITVAEDIGVGKRGEYYDKTGALRDMVPNHIFQLVSLIAMEAPVSFAADAIRDEQVKLLRAIQPMTPERVLRDTVRGQYEAGPQQEKGYRVEEHVTSDSTTETFAALKLYIDNWRWAGVPIYLRTGKRLPRRVSEIAVQFKEPPHLLFRGTDIDQLQANRLLLHIQPDEGISLRFGAKVPGSVMKLGSVDMNFRYEDYFKMTPTTGYERLLYDCMLGDASLFQRSDMVEASWKVVEPILASWRAVSPQTFPNYQAGSWGPQEAFELIGRDGRKWSSCMG